LRAFFGLHEGPLVCERFADPPGTFPIVMFDASTTGGGALLWVVPANRDIKPEEVKALKPWAYLAITWDHIDEDVASATIASCASQARWEFYMLLISILTWQGVLFRSKGTLRVIGDALGILHNAVKFKSKDAVINLMCMEIALLFAPSGAELEAVHLWSEQNDIADGLSRLGEGAPLPELCAKVPRGTARRDGLRVLGRKLPHHRAQAGLPFVEEM